MNAIRTRAPRKIQMWRDEGDDDDDDDWRVAKMMSFDVSTCDKVTSFLIFYLPTPDPQEHPSIVHHEWCMPCPVPCWFRCDGLHCVRSVVRTRQLHKTRLTPASAMSFHFFVYVFWTSIWCTLCAFCVSWLIAFANWPLPFFAFSRLGCECPNGIFTFT